ncbi:thioesterase domain-containing protein [Streptomyces sp. ADMS]|uniref:phosphopantetheine-binding protein n=1 Tax=Streptomyces sp. ADMS TaxID=3071415 RepID=UPI00296E2CFB|nr:phosphopantetheine-binding protein [Streptomyces sp. ADMS]MDW4909138.1 thioesterase domain-containing protein [Streptomyces sp. ADMS]
MLPEFVERDAIDAVVAAQWSRILGSPPAALDADFFALGGTSLKAARLATALRGASNVKVPLQRIFELRTFQGISSWLRGDAPAVNGRFVTLNATGTGTPLLLVPAASGGVVGLHRFGGDPVDRPVHGLQALGLSPQDGPPSSSLIEVVADFVEVLEASEAPRRLHLAGYCVGGILAYELAQALHDRGWEISSLLLLNTSLYCPPLTVEEGMREKLEQLVAEASLAAETAGRGVEAVFQELATGEDHAEFDARVRVFGSVGAAISGYVPEPVDFPVRLFSTDDRDDPADIARTAHPVTDWPDLGLPDYQQYAVPVDHFEMINHAPTLATVEAVMAEIDSNRW